MFGQLHSVKALRIFTRSPEITGLILQREKPDNTQESALTLMSACGFWTETESKTP